MDVLEMKEDAAWEKSDREKKEAVAHWNKTKPVGTIVCGPYRRPRSYDDGGGEWVSEVAHGRTTSAAYIYKYDHVVVDIEGNTRVPIQNLFEPEGSSPALKYPCPVCKVPVGIYCKRDDGSRQIIAHKRRMTP